MVPTSYTVEEYVNYLRNEVLLETANELEWPDLVTPEIALPEVKTVSAHTADTITVPALINRVAIGSLLIFEGGFARTVSEDSDVAATSITFEPDLTTEDPDGEKVLIRYTRDIPQIPNPKFIAVTDEVLRQMGLENIEQINITNVRVFRLLGRLELLRRITENRVPYFDENTVWYDTDRNFAPRVISDTPSILTQQLLALYNREVVSINAELNLVVPVEVPQTGIPAESLSQSSGVKITW